MELLNECFKCTELQKSLQVEKKKVSQKNRLITLLKELVRSYEAKDLNLTISDLSQIYESSSSEVTILRQRLNLYLNENQELLQSKNEISSRNDLLEKKFRDVEDELSHLRFVNKQLGDYYREKETDHDQHKDRLKKLARKLLLYEPKNAEVRKILNLQNSPIDLDVKPVKNGNRKKSEDNIKDMKKDNIDEEDDPIDTKTKTSDSLNPDELDMSCNSECENDTDCNETNNSCIEEGSNSISSEPAIDTIEVNGISNDFLMSKSFDDKSNSEKSCEIISNNGDSIITCEESDSSPNCIETSDHCSFYKNISNETSNIEVDVNKTKSSNTLPSLFEEDSCPLEDVDDQNEVDANLKDSNNFLEFEDSLPNLISPLKSDEPRTLGLLNCKQTLKPIHDNAEHVDTNQEETEVNNNSNIEKVSTDIKNECSSNSGDQIDKKKKSPFQSKYQPLINGDLLFTEKPINSSHIPLSGNYASNYQFQSSHCLGCCNNSFDTRPPVTLKLYNCSNIEISIPPVMPNQELPIITVSDKCGMNKSCINGSNNDNKLGEPSAIHCSFIHDRRSNQYYDNSNNQHKQPVKNSSKPWLSRSDDNIKESSNPYFQERCDESKNPDYYFLDYLSKNKLNKCKFREHGDETDSDTIKCSRLFPIKAGTQLDMEHFCYRFATLSVKSSSPDPPCFKVSPSSIMNSTNQFYSSLFNISKPPIFHNSLKDSGSSTGKSEWVFGQNVFTGTKKQVICNKAAAIKSSILNIATQENSTSKTNYHNTLQKSVMELKTDYLNKKNINDTLKNNITANKSFQNPFHNKIHEKIELKGSNKCFESIRFVGSSENPTIHRKGISSENRQVVLSQSCVKQPVPNNQVLSEGSNHNPLRNNSAKLQTSSPWIRTGPGTSKSESLIASSGEGCSKSIFDLDRGKNASSSTTHSSVLNKSKSIPASYLSQEEAKKNSQPEEAKKNSQPEETKSDGVLKPPALINSHCTEEEVAEIKSKSPKKDLQKGIPSIERPLVLKEKSPKTISSSQFPQSTNLSVAHETSFKKPNAVNIKGNSDIKVNESNFECNSLVNKEVKAVSNQKSTVQVPKKIEHCSKLNKTESSPEAKRHCSQNILTLQNGLNKEPKPLNGSILKPGKKRVHIAAKKSVNNSHSSLTDAKEDDNDVDNELQEIFREMEHFTLPLLSPLRRTPEIPVDEKSSVDKVKKIKGKSISGKKAKIIKSNKSLKISSSMEVDDEKINLTQEKSVETKEEHSKYEIINSKLNNCETVSGENSNLEKNLIITKSKKEFKINSPIEFDDEKTNSTQEKTVETKEEHSKFEIINSRLNICETICGENSNLVKNDKITKSKKEFETKSSTEVDNEKINLTQEKAVETKEEHSKFEIINCRLNNCETISGENSNLVNNDKITKSEKEFETKSSTVVDNEKINSTQEKIVETKEEHSKYEIINSSPNNNEAISVENSNFEKHDEIIKSNKELETNSSKEVQDEKINSTLEKPTENKDESSNFEINISRLNENEIVNESEQLFSSDDEREYNIFSDRDEASVDLNNSKTIHHKEDSENNEIVEDKKMESLTEPVVSPVNDEPVESEEIASFTKTEEIKIYSRKRKKPTDNISEAESYAPVTSSTECTSKISEGTFQTTTYNSNGKEVKPSDDDNAEPHSNNYGVKKPSIGLGFYVNRSDEESDNDTSVPSCSYTSELESSTISSNANPDVSNIATKDISFIPDDCHPENNQELHDEEMDEENVPLEKEESSSKKRKLHGNNEHVEGMCSKKQKMLSDDEYISCESDVFICALRYLSAVAVASFDGKVCPVSKTNTDANLASKIAINHIKNLIIESRQFIDDIYNNLNSSVKKMLQIKDASPTNLAKAIIELIVESNDKTEAKDKPYMPSMTKTVKTCLLVAVSFIGYNRGFVMEFCEVFEQYISSFYDKTLTVPEGSQLVIFYASFCRSYNLDDKVKYLIYDVLYTRNIKAYPMVYKAIQTWPDILPHSETCFSKDCLLTQTIVFILLSGASSADEKSLKLYCIHSIRTYLFKYFGYKINFTRREDLVDKIIGNIGAKGGSVALVLLCKCEPWEWSLYLVEKRLLPILRSSKHMDEFTVCEYILTVGRIVRGFPITKAAHVVKNTLEVFEHMLQESNSTHVNEIIIEAVSLLRRHNLMKCTSILMSWKPNTKQITKKTVNHISSILRVKNVAYWKNVYSAHSSNIIHNTRTFYKKKRSGFQNTA